MNAGALRALITLSEPVDGERDDNYGEVDVFIPRAKVWAELRPQTAREAIAAQQVQSSGTYTVVIRAPRVGSPYMGLNAKWRIEYLGENYNIRGEPLKNAARDEWTLTAEIASYGQ